MGRWAGLGLVFAAACAGQASPPDDTDTDSVAAPPSLPVARCGMTPYTVSTDARLGTVTDWGRTPGWDLSPGGLDALLTLAGFEELTPVPHGVTLLRFTYVTQDRGEVVEATGLIGLPKPVDGAPDAPWPVALLLHGFAGVSDACAPSADALIGPALPALLAANGFVAIAPDYLGLKGAGAPSTSPHAPLVGEQLAFGAWDAVRASRQLLGGDAAGLLQGSARDDLVIWGASQGGHGALWADLTAPYLAPEEDVVAVVAASPAHDLRAVVQAAVAAWSDATGLSALAFVGMRRWYGQPDDLHGLIANDPPQHLADTVEAALTELGDTCAVDVEVQAETVADVYADGFVDAVTSGRWEDAEPWSCFLDANGLTSTDVTPLGTHPTLLVYGEDDPIVVPELQHADFDRMCGEGWSLQALQCADAGHAETTLWSLPEQLAFLRAALDGSASTPTCTWALPTRCSATPADE